MMCVGKLEMCGGQAMCVGVWVVGVGVSVGVGGS